MPVTGGAISVVACPAVTVTSAPSGCAAITGAGLLPLSVATVDLDEGVRFIGNVLNCSPEDVKIGARVKLAWDKLNDDNNYPAFELA